MTTLAVSIVLGVSLGANWVLARRSPINMPTLFDLIDEQTTEAEA